MERKVSSSNPCTVCESIPDDKIPCKWLCTGDLVSKEGRTDAHKKEFSGKDARGASDVVFVGLGYL